MAGTTGQPVDLTNCDREPIHLLGAVQPFGFLLVLSRRWLTISRASRNAAEHLGQKNIVGRPIADILAPDAVHRIRSDLQTAVVTDSVARSFGIPLTQNGPVCDIAVHGRGNLAFVDCEPTNDFLPAEFGISLRTVLGQLQQSRNSQIFHRLAVEQMRSMTGFDRVMIYRFGHDGSGEVIAESARSDLEPFLGLRYPASDIPRQARILYERNWLRIIPDIEAEPILIDPPFDDDGAPLDLSMSILRSVSPIHIEYLQNMGVAASMSVSILKDGKLWGLFACHHYSPFRVSFERRTAAELLGQVYSMLVESRERAEEATYEIRARGKLADLTRELTTGTASAEGIADHLDKLGGLIECDGIGCSIGGKGVVRGVGPTVEEFEGLVNHLGETGITEVHASYEIRSEYPEAKAFADRAAGMLVVPLSRTARDYVVFFRREVSHTVNWAGNPTKVAIVGPLGERLTPRKSFELWKQTVKGQSKPWLPVERRIAESMRVVLLEVVLQLAELAEAERRRAEQRQQLLIGELHHRLRNVLNLFRSVVARSLDSAESVEQFAEIVTGRIDALARAHSLIEVDNWDVVSLHKLVEAEAQSHIDDPGQRIDISGVDVRLQPNAFTSVALVIHEMVTNAAKYGALSNAEGRIKVVSEVDPDGNLQIAWEEAGGPQVAPPERRGFGSTMIERAIPHELGGKAEVSHHPSGVKAGFSIPAVHVLDVGVERSESKMDEAAADWVPGSMLVVEDDVIIALDLEATLQGLGVADIRVAGRVADALSRLENWRPDFALIDVHLGGDTGFAVAERLHELAVPFAFSSGQSDPLDFPEPMREAAVISKPYSRDSILDAFRAVSAAAG